MRNYLSIFIISIVFLSCNLDNRKPEYKRVENLQLVDFRANKIIIKADAIIYNPNGISIYLNKTEIDVFANDIKVSHISQAEKTEILKKSEFKIPLKVIFNPKDLVESKGSIIDILSNVLKSLENNKIDLKFKGKATFQVAKLEFDVPIEYEDELLLKK